MLGVAGRGQGDPRPPPQTRAPLGGCGPAPSRSKLSPQEPRSFACPCGTEGKPVGGQHDVGVPRGSHESQGLGLPFCPISTVPPNAPQPGLACPPWGTKASQVTPVGPNQPPACYHTSSACR